MQFRWRNKKERGHKKIQKEDDKTKLLLPKKMGGGEGTKMRAGAECKEGRKKMQKAKGIQETTEVEPR